MKIRQGFVSNSSSSSFVINKQCLTVTQKQMIFDAVNVANQYSNIDTYGQPWAIEEEDGFIKGNTLMDNFDMKTFLAEIGVPTSFIKWEE